MKGGGHDTVKIFAQSVFIVNVPG